MFDLFTEFIAWFVDKQLGDKLVKKNLTPSVNKCTAICLLCTTEEDFKDLTKNLGLDI